MSFKVPIKNLLAHSKFAALAEVDEVGGPAADEGASATGPPVNSEAGTGATVAVFSEAEVAKELEELQNGWASSCPVFAGSARQAAHQEIEALVAWLPEQYSRHPEAALQKAVSRQLSCCKEALVCLRF